MLRHIQRGEQEGLSPNGSYSSDKVKLAHKKAFYFAVIERVQHIPNIVCQWTTLILEGTENTRLTSKGITTCQGLKRQENGLPFGTEGHSFLQKMQITARTEAAGAQGRSVFSMPL